MIRAYKVRWTRRLLCKAEDLMQQIRCLGEFKTRSQIRLIFPVQARCGMQATAFSLHPEKQTLQLTLQLEAQDAE